MTNTVIFSKLIKQSLQLILPILFVAAIFTYFIFISTRSLAEITPFDPVLFSTKNLPVPKLTHATKKEATTPDIVKKPQKNKRSFIDKHDHTSEVKENTENIKKALVQTAATTNIDNYDSSSSIELILNTGQKHDHIWDFSADARAVYTRYEKQLNNGEIIKDTDLLLRIRGDAIATISDNLRAGFGLAGTCAISNCDLDFTLQTDLPSSTGLKKGQFTIDEMYLHWLSDEPHRFKLAIGRMQTRSVLKTGVFNKSLNRINSNNARINWTDGVHATYQLDNGWTSNFIMQYNSEEGSGNVYHDAIDFTDSESSKSYFASFENNQKSSGLTQRSLGISYLPSALLSSQEIAQDGTQQHDDYLGLVGKVAWLWPQKNNRITLRGGFEFGYSPTLPNHDVIGIADEEAVNGLAWNAVFNIMDIYPGQNFGINYAHTGAGWQLSPQYKPNTKLLELRYQWQLKSATLFEARLRWQDELEASQVIDDTDFKDNQVDFYVRLTRSF
jgi:hypothetical protein